MKKLDIATEQRMLMLCSRCGVCCEETEMLLSNGDIERLKRKGYDRDFFVRFDNEGYATLRNREGNCVFFEPEKRVCIERANRPLGCRIYPVMVDENKGNNHIVVDEACPAHSSVSEKEKAKRGKKCIKLLAEIDADAEKRRSQ